MKTVIHLQTKRVYATNSDNTPKIEKIVVKLEDGDNFNKFVKHMHLRGYLTSDPPRVLKVLQKPKATDGWDKAKEIDKTPWQDKVEAALNQSSVKGEIDYKQLSEKQSAQMKRMADRLDALEAKENGSTLTDDINQVIDANNAQNVRDLLEAKANELEITFRNNIGDTKLLEKIQAIEPDFKL